MNPSLLKDVKITRVVNSVTAGQAATAGTILDMSGFEGVMFVAALGDVSDTSVVTLSAEQNTANSASGMAALSGSATFTAGATSADNKLLVLDVYRPRERYVRCIFTSATANAVKDGVIAVQYGPRTMPVTQSSTVLDSDTLVEPAEA